MWEMQGTALPLLPTPPPGLGEPPVGTYSTWRKITALSGTWIQPRQRGRIQWQNTEAGTKLMSTPVPSHPEGPMDACPLPVSADDCQEMMFCLQALALATRFPQSGFMSLPRPATNPATQSQERTPAQPTHLTAPTPCGTVPWAQGSSCSMPRARSPNTCCLRVALRSPFRELRGQAGGLPGCGSWAACKDGS